MPRWSPSLRRSPCSLLHASDIRYLAALIPLCIFLTGLSVLTLTRYMSLLAIPLAIVAFETNILNQPLTPDKWRSSICQWIDELKTARTTSIQQAVDWINENVQPGQSVWVYPDYMTYPLMYHAPHALYAWQLIAAAAGTIRESAADSFSHRRSGPITSWLLDAIRKSGKACEYVKKHVECRLRCLQHAGCLLGRHDAAGIVRTQLQTKG